MDIQPTQDNLPACGTIEQLEQHMLTLDQGEASVYHYFGPGICIREVNLPAGHLSVGHIQKYSHINIMLKGRVIMLKDDGSLVDLKAPVWYVGTPGRKIGWVVEDVIWQNIYATDLKDAEAVEAYFIEKSDGFEAAEFARFSELYLSCEDDRKDFSALVGEYGYTPEQVRAQSENEADQIAMPDGCYDFKIGDSPIEGRGVIATARIHEGALIGAALIDGKRTPIGRYCNHSASPNAEFRMVDGSLYLFALRDIGGQSGGFDGEEITIDYRLNVGVSMMGILQ